MKRSSDVRRKRVERDSSLFSGWTMATWFESMSFLKLLDLNCGDLPTRPWLRWGLPSSANSKGLCWSADGTCGIWLNGSCWSSNYMYAVDPHLGSWKPRVQMDRSSPCDRSCKKGLKSSDVQFILGYSASRTVCRASFDDPLEPQKMCWTHLSWANFHHM